MYKKFSLFSHIWGVVGCIRPKLYVIQYAVFLQWTNQIKFNMIFRSLILLFTSENSRKDIQKQVLIMSKRSPSPDSGSATSKMQHQSDKENMSPNKILHELYCNVIEGNDMFNRYEC